MLFRSVDSSTFEDLQQHCDGEQSCSYEFNGYVMDTSCNNVNADYLQVFYDCSHVTQGPVAFMVRNLERQQLSIYDVVPWRDVVTNFGVHYDVTSRSFVCPYNGVYIFSTTILTFNDIIGVYMYKNNDELVMVFADDENVDLDSSSGSVVTECLSGDVVWVQVEVGGNFLSHTSNYHFFSGFILTKL